MTNKDDFIAIAKQFIKFGIVGISNTAISLIIYYIFIWINTEMYIIGNAIGFVVSVLNAYYWNNKYVFQKKNKSNIKSLFRTFIAYGSTFLVSTGLLYYWISCLGISESIAPIINLLITIPLNFLINKFWAFR